MTDFKASLEAAAETHICNYPDRRDANWRFIQGALWTLDSAVVREMVDALKNYRTYTIATARPEYVDELIAPMNKALAAYEQARESTLKGSKEAGVE